MDALSPLPPAAGAPDNRIQVLNSQIEKTLSQCREAHSIVRTYDQIVKHLKVRLLQCGKGDIWKERNFGLTESVGTGPRQDPPTHWAMPGMSTSERLISL